MSSSDHFASEARTIETGPIRFSKRPICSVLCCEPLRGAKGQWLHTYKMRGAISDQATESKERNKKI
jgi:hypothetical protein